ncbi:tail fiber domain-containing protein, partial [Gammaproteobacteria bacterium]|nr:tail fiber domain-containing protein [Gammaproteobacteria bacterium]
MACSNDPYSGVSVDDLSTRAGMISAASIPALRLEQDGSRQIWEVAGDEANFFVRDVTNGSSLPFRIRPGAPTNAVVIDNKGDVGIGIDNPGVMGIGGQGGDASIHVKRSDGDASIFIEETNGTQKARDLFHLKNNGNAQIVLQNTASNTWRFMGGGNFIVSDAGDTTDEFVLDAVGNLKITGTLTQSSDRYRKTRIQSVDPGEVLAKVNDLDIATWAWRSGDPSLRHMGPMAQDFYAAFA